MSLSPVHTSYMTKPATKNKVFKSSAKLGANSAPNGTWVPAKSNKKPNKIKGVIDFFQDNTSSSNLKTVIEKVEKRQHLMACLYEALESVKLDSIANQLEPGTISPDGTLVLQVKHSTTAAKLQQRLPSILRYLRESKWDIISIRVKVLPVSTKSTEPSDPTLTSPKIMSEVGKQSWGNLEKNLPPDSNLLEVVKKLISKINK
jgi:hypothetical protein